MKLKQQPDDFQVEELTDVTPSDHGTHSLYRLEKRSWTTPDALAAIRQRWRIDLHRVSYGGLKDRHAQTVQYFTIFHGPKRNLKHQEIAVRYLGQLAEPFTSKDIRANRFCVTLRDLPAAQTAVIEQAAAEVVRDGVPNYFDDQRFGSVADGEFVARLLVRGRWEEALRLALVTRYSHDRAAEKREKSVLRTCWGDWATCAERLPRGHARILADYLASHPDDYRGAMARLRPELRGLYLSAYQSHLWNRMLARWLEQNCRPEQLQRVPLRLGEVPMHRHLDPEQHAQLAALQLPLPSARLKLDADDPQASLVNGILAEEGLELRQLQIKGIREMFFSKGERAALCRPGDLSSHIEPDERHAGQSKAVLSFALPRGGYATLIVKRVQSAF